MDVPYHSSGALGRAHYAIVRKVETSESVQTADQHIMLEIESVKSQLAQSRLDIATSKECLLILLYCSLACSPGLLPSTAFNFAFFPAITLAERGKTLDDKRIGYRFCTELMPLEHEAGLMLVNTLRKDLESDELTYICLALDSLLALPTEHMVAAVQDRLNQLIDHESPLVRRRTLLAFRSLAAQNPMILERIKNVVTLCLHDEDDSVSHATLALLSQSDVVDREKYQQAVKEVLSNKLASLNVKDLRTVSKIMPYLKTVSPLNDYIPLLFKALRQSAKTYDNTARSLIVDIFWLLSSLDADTYGSAEREQKMSTVRAIRRFLKSSEPDDVYVFFAALECVPVAAWAGTDADHPAVLAEDEFQRILEFLNHSDPIIRAKVMKVIRQVDPAVLDSHISLLREAMKAPSGGIDLSCCLQALEALRIRYTDDGSKYAEMTLELLKETSLNSTADQVFEPIVDCVLRDEALTSRQEFGRTFARRFLGYLSDDGLNPGSTALVISSALSVEFASILGATAATDILTAFASRLSALTGPVQEPCILAMIRLCAEVNEMSPSVTSSVTELTSKSTRSVRKYCKLFLEFGQEKHALQEVINSCKSSSLPDFLSALSMHRSRLRHLEQRSQASTPVSRRSIDHTRSGPSSRTPSRLKFVSSDVSSEINTQASRLDLISLESPFHVDAADENSAVNFGETWNGLDPKSEVRGWSLGLVAEILEKIRGLDDHDVKLLSMEAPPFQGELKLLITSSSGTGTLALRLRQAEEDSCLYRFRCDEGAAAIKTLITPIISS